jgi:polysaccharide export outer membrane protein
VSRFRATAIGVAFLFLCEPAALVAQTAQPAPDADISSKPAAVLNTDQPDPDRPALEHRFPRYKIQRDDVLFLTFPLSTEFNQTVTVQPDGYVNLQGAGGLYIQGMTIPQVIEAFKHAYAKILHDPIIDVDLTDFQKPFFIVSGQVGKPGQYDLRYDTTVSEAIAIAGGFTPQAKTQVFLYHRISDGWVEVKKLNLKDILHGKNVNEDAVMKPGDMIFVPEKFITNFRKYVPYSVGMYLSPKLPLIN